MTGIRLGAAVLAPLVGWLPASESRAAAADREAPWYAGKLDATVGVDYRTGDYGRPDDTDILVVPFSARYRFQQIGFTQGDEVRLRLSIPYLEVEGPERGSASAGARGTDRGIGDLSLRGTYVFVPKRLRWLPNVYLSGKVKFPTASESDDLGTGEYDYTLDLALRKRLPIGSTWLRSIKPFAGVGYEFVGEPSGESRNDSLRAIAGTSFEIKRRLDLGLRYSFRESTIPGRGDFHVISPFVAYRATRWLHLTPYAVFGLSERSPDWGTGIAVRFTKAIE